MNYYHIKFINSPYIIDLMKNELLIGAIAILIAAAGLFNYESSMSNNALSQFESFK